MVMSMEKKIILKKIKMMSFKYLLISSAGIQMRLGICRCNCGLNNGICSIYSGYNTVAD